MHDVTGQPKTFLLQCHIIANHSFYLPVPHIIKSIAKFFNMIGYHQPDLSTERTVYTSCLKLDSVIGQLVRF